MKNLSIIIFLLFISNSIHAQKQNIQDSLKAVINKDAGDTNEVNALIYLASQQSQFDSTIEYLERGFKLAQKLKYQQGEANYFMVKAQVMHSKDISETIQDYLNALNIYKELDDIPGIVSAQGMLAVSYEEIGDYKNALLHEYEGEKLAKAKNVKGWKFVKGNRNVVVAFLAEISQTYVLLNQLDSAKLYAEKAIIEKDLYNGAEWNFPYYLLATIENLKGNYKTALEGYRSAIPLAMQNGFFQDTLQIFSGMSTTFKDLGQLDSSIYYASLVEQSQNTEREIKTFLEALNNLAVCYKLKGNKDSALKYMELNYAYKDSIFSKEKGRRIQNITFNEKIKQQEIIAAQAEVKSRLQFYGLVAGLLILLLITGILWRNNLQKQKAKNKIEHAYAVLKSTQSQLIQSEKMASLGELTAGIAHEIQNPLNFVNNFSEVNKEMLEELKAERLKSKAERDEQIEADIINDVIENSEKINHHGKRAGDIVKGMLQHSRSSAGVKESTDINALADEYLRLSYHGLRAKDKDFNATMKTDFDSSIGKINIIPQDIGRVLLNLYNNAFYACAERSRSSVNEHASTSSAGLTYEPTVTVRTFLNPPLEGREDVIITVSDNGNGIPQKIVDKIFQPFFTTKPTGQGTGLGLSLSYDIIKAHGGEIKVETKEGEGTSFTVFLSNI